MSLSILIFPTNGLLEATAFRIYVLLGLLLNKTMHAYWRYTLYISKWIIAYTPEYRTIFFVDVILQKVIHKKIFDWCILAHIVCINATTIFFRVVHKPNKVTIIPWDQLWFIYLLLCQQTENDVISNQINCTSYYTTFRVLN